MCYCVSWLTFQNCDYNFGFTREIGVVYEKMKCVVLCGCLCEIFNRELWFYKEENRFKKII